MAAVDSENNRRRGEPARQPSVGGGNGIGRRLRPQNGSQNGPPQRLFGSADNDFLPESNIKCLNANCQDKCKPTESRADRDDIDGPCQPCIEALCRKLLYIITIPIYSNLRERHSKYDDGFNYRYEGKIILAVCLLIFTESYVYRGPPLFRH